MKCSFGQRQIKVLSHLVDGSGARPDPYKVRAVREFPSPCSSSDVRCFLGLSSYFRRFTPNFADTTRSLTTILKKDVPFPWGFDQARPFTTLFAALTAPPVTAHFRPSAPTELRSDASGH
ncbi:uncharacterized protein LOC144112504, partial [Amblyomma americanum]